MNKWLSKEVLTIFFTNCCASRVNITCNILFTILILMSTRIYIIWFFTLLLFKSNHSSTVSYPLKYLVDQVLEAKITIDQGNVNLSFWCHTVQDREHLMFVFSIENSILINLFDFSNWSHLCQNYAYWLNLSLSDVAALFPH